MVPADELARRMKPFDGDGDGNLTQPELARFLLESRVGGPWFCEMIARTCWRLAEERWAKEIQTISIEALGRALNFSMSRGPRPERRYVLTPAAVQGLEPRKDLEGREDLWDGQPEPKAAPRSAAPPARPATTPGARPPAPRGAAPGPRTAPLQGPPRGAPSSAAAGRPAPRRPGPGQAPGPKPRR